ncbi:sigma factor-like helix-turn-helix DNA-binding protein [Hydrogenobacter thermophilus]|uniref:sigma factor-like helix-turn-helix DNA-binding protein n=1 Tax=Hydrogenobacter thermophilus TaxID=940 RepID=UPI0030F57614
MIVKVKIADLYIPQGLLPRILTGTDPATVERYAQALEAGEELPPIKVWKREGVYWVIDGIHRIEAYKQLGRQTIEAELIECEDELDYRIKAIRENLKHGLPLTNEEKRENMRLLYKLGKKDIEELAKLFSVPRSTAYYWLEDLTKEEQAEVVRKVLELRKQGYTQEQIAREVGLSRSRVAQILTEKSEMLENPKLEKLTFPPTPEQVNAIISPWIEGWNDPHQRDLINSFCAYVSKNNIEVEGKCGEVVMWMVQETVKALKKLALDGVEDWKVAEAWLMSQTFVKDLTTLAKRNWLERAKKKWEEVKEEVKKERELEEKILNTTKLIFANPKFIFSSIRNFADGLRSEFPTWKVIYNIDTTLVLQNVPREKIEEILRKHWDELYSIYQTIPELPEDIILEGLIDIWGRDRKLSWEEFQEDVIKRGYRPTMSAYEYYLTLISPSLSSQLAGSQPALSDDDDLESWNFHVDESELKPVKKEEKKLKPNAFDAQKQLEDKVSLIEELMLDIINRWGVETFDDVMKRLNAYAERIKKIAREGRWKETRL